jgi:hypothetical protein
VQPVRHARLRLWKCVDRSAPPGDTHTGEAYHCHEPPHPRPTADVAPTHSHSQLECGVDSVGTRGGLCVLCCSGKKGEDEDRSIRPGTRETVGEGGQHEYSQHLTRRKQHKLGASWRARASCRDTLNAAHPTPCPAPSTAQRNALLRRPLFWVGTGCHLVIHAMVCQFLRGRAEALVRSLALVRMRPARRHVERQGDHPVASHQQRQAAFQPPPLHGCLSRFTERASGHHRGCLRVARAPPHDRDLESRKRSPCAALPPPFTCGCQIRHARARCDNRLLLPSSPRFVSYVG